MLGLILIYFIGKGFYKLAELHNRNLWGITIAGIAMYLGSQFLLGLVLGLILGVDAEGNVGGMNSLVLNLIGLVIGCVFTYGLYELLKHQ